MAEPGATVEQALAAIDRAFGGVQRPRDAELLDERCYDDNDLAALYLVDHWRELSDAAVEGEYAALSFLSPAGFRHFLPAYMSFTLRHLDSGAAAVDATIWSLAPSVYAEPELQEFTASKFAGFDEDQRAAVVAFLEAVRAAGNEYDAGEAEKALRHWR